MKNRIIFILIITVILFPLYAAESQNLIKNENLNGKKMILPSSKLMRNEDSKDINPLVKNLKILTIINGSCPVCINELKKWKTYMKTVDTSQVGFVYLIQSDDDLFTFKQLNKEYIKLNYPYFYDVKKNISKVNNLNNTKASNTFLLDDKNKIILKGNPNMNKELFRKYNTEITKRIKKKESIVEINQGLAGSTFKIGNGFIYKDQNGKILSKTESDKLMSDNNYIPNIDTEKSVITFKKR